MGDDDRSKSYRAYLITYFTEVEFRRAGGESASLRDFGADEDVAACVLAQRDVEGGAEVQTKASLLAEVDRLFGRAISLPEAT